MKAAIVILSDPKSESEEALGRVFNALAVAYDYKQANGEVEILFHGAGTRWIGELSKKDHPANALYEEVKDYVAGASCGCTEVFGATEEIAKSGLDLIKDNPVPGTPGLTSLRRYIEDGYNVLTF